MTGVRRGRLRPTDDAPAAGERIEPVALLSGVRVEQILSGELADPADYLQDHDEWVVVLSGGAVLEIEGSEVRLSKRGMDRAARRHPPPSGSDRSRDELVDRQSAIPDPLSTSVGRQHRPLS
jgi:hypothetical protein